MSFEGLSTRTLHNDLSDCLSWAFRLGFSALKISQLVYQMSKLTLIGLIGEHSTIQISYMDSAVLPA